MTPSRLPSRARLWLPLAGLLAASGCRAAPAEIDPAHVTGQEAVADPTSPGEAPARGVPASLGRLAFVNGGDVWVKDIPDGQSRRLTQDGRNDTPRWSPSGEWLAFRKGAAADELWLVRRSGADARRAGTLSPGAAPALAWSPVADRLACVTTDGVLVIEPGGAPQALVSPAGGDVLGLAWSPNGEQLAYVQERITRPAAGVRGGEPPERYAALWLIAAGGGEATELLNAGQPATHGFMLAGWSPGGTHVLSWTVPMFSGSLLADGVPLLAVPAAGGEVVELTAQMLAHTDFLSWSPDGQQLAFVEGAGRATWEDKAIAIATLGDAGTPRRELRTDGTIDLFPTWSPDGRWLAVSSGPAAPGAAGEGPAAEALQQRRIRLVQPQGQDQLQLTDMAGARDERPDWSADGSTILFVRLQDERAQLWLTDAGGSNQRAVGEELTPNPAAAGAYGYVRWALTYDWWKGPADHPGHTG
ncbi:MAG TPA: hypothetical protein VHS99_09800 [Chloroflexota bacterium]|nr:hypothetical protein [Chloroflexota bacterium]